MTNTEKVASGIRQALARGIIEHWMYVMHQGGKPAGGCAQFLALCGMLDLDAEAATKLFYMEHDALRRSSHQQAFANLMQIPYVLACNLNDCHVAGIPALTIAIMLEQGHIPDDAELSYLEIQRLKKLYAQ